MIKFYNYKFHNVYYEITLYNSYIEMRQLGKLEMRHFLVACPIQTKQGKED